MERAVHDFDLDVDDLIARIHTALDGFFDARDNRRDVFFGIAPPTISSTTSTPPTLSFGVTVMQAWPY